MIYQLSQCFNHKKFEHHWNYLVANRIRLYFFDGNTNYYSKCLNTPKRLKETRGLNKLVASVVEVI